MKKVFLIAAIFMLVFSYSIFSADITLKGGGGIKKWSTAGSWIGSIAPTSTDRVFLSTTSADLLINGNFTCFYFIIQSGYTGTITFSPGATLTVTGNWTNSGAPNIVGGSFEISGDFANYVTSFTAASTSFTFNGLGDQTIYTATLLPSVQYTFGILVIDKPASTTITLQSDLGVGSLNYTSGILDDGGNHFYEGGTGTPFPIELVSFSSKIYDNNVILMWSTATEVNNYGFEVLRSHNRNEWGVLGFLEGHGNSNSPQSYNFTDDKIRAAGSYLYKLKQIDNDGKFTFSKTIEVNIGLPTKLELKQNYPNPFNPSTTIGFSLPVSGNVSLKIFNPLGKEVKTLINRYTEAGKYSFKFNAEDLPSGMYIYQLTTDKNSLTKKMLFLK